MENPEYRRSPQARDKAAGEEAAKIGREIDAMAVSGLASTGKRVPHQERVREVIGVWSALVPREAVRADVVMIES